MSKTVDGAEVAKHSTKKSCWIVLDSKAYDVTSFLSDHPGGAPIILRNAGTVSGQIQCVVQEIAINNLVGCNEGVQELPPIELSERLLTS